jgi:4'-phosphopantetheinyl transferase EntD
MIEALLPIAACSEMFSDAPETTMLTAEAAIVATAAADRRREFGTVRHCARQALGKLGLPAAPILPDFDGVPQWPAGIVGSMTHCRGYRAAAVARISHARGLGIDAEPDSPLPEMIRDLVLHGEERAQFALLALLRDTSWDGIFFCAKEAVFKAWYPITRIWLDFTDISVTLHSNNTFRALVHASPPAGMARTFSGRWRASDGIIAAATWIAGADARVERHPTIGDTTVLRQQLIEAPAQ